MDIFRAVIDRCSISASICALLLPRVYLEELTLLHNPDTLHLTRLLFDLRQLNHACQHIPFDIC